MPNMSYCRFQNTLGDLREVAESDGIHDPESLSREERRARSALIKMCAQIVSEHYDEDEDEPYQS